MIIAIIVVSLCAVVAIFFGYRLRQQDKKLEKKVPTLDANREGLYIVKEYIPSNFAYFLEILNDIIPRSCVAYPYVRAGKILRCTSAREDLKELMKEVVDICLFEKESMAPILVIDLVDFSLQNNTLRDQKEELVKIFRAVKMPFVKFMVLESYDVETLKNTIYVALPPETRSKLRFEGHIVDQNDGFVDPNDGQEKKEDK